MSWKKTINTGEVLRQMYPETAITIMHRNNWCEEDWDAYFERN